MSIRIAINGFGRRSYKEKLRAGGSLADVAPTFRGVLAIVALPEMTGRDLRISCNFTTPDRS